ncbi:hypothetical protein GT037_001576 [Alternaria burnsii]|uniref:Uncharacterized protein n=1 Tax=Alternaria burnsii TaxID=1187904 RepID=A0A8H7BB92_9PLEO|nr:uncharacterized protein GT037_001576 [Alternaria burnsii]KAF7679925.1 hypothetical protein GT037_001576 [Alternaria burnsii]
MASQVCKLLEEKWESSRGRVGISPTPQVPGCVFELVFLGLGSGTLKGSRRTESL